MSAPAQADGSFQPAVPAKAGKQKRPKPPKPQKPLGMGPWLLIMALAAAAAAVVVLKVPIPGLTVGPGTSPTSPTSTPTAAAAKAPQAPAADDGLSKREQAVAQKEAELAAREEALKQKEAAAAAVLKELGIAGPETSSVSQVAKMYGSMAPYKAAPLMAKLDTETAVQVLRLMTHDEAAAILSNMDPDRGAAIMRELARPLVSNPAGG